MMRKVYEAPEAEITIMKRVDIITSSGPVDLGGDNIDDFDDEDTNPTPIPDIHIDINN